MSTRLDYTISELRKQVTARRDRVIAKAEADYEKDRLLTERRNEWREEQEKRVRSLARRLKDVADNELESFHVPSPPRLSSWDKPKRARDQKIDEARKAHDRAQARLDALRAPQGVVSLTANMLNDWFGL